MHVLDSDIVAGHVRKALQLPRTACIRELWRGSTCRRQDRAVHSILISALIRTILALIMMISALIMRISALIRMFLLHSRSGCGTRYRRWRCTRRCRWHCIGLRTGSLPAASFRTEMARRNGKGRGRQGKVSAEEAGGFSHRSRCGLRRRARQRSGSNCPGTRYPGCPRRTEAAAIQNEACASQPDPKGCANSGKGLCQRARAVSATWTLVLMWMPTPHSPADCSIPQQVFSRGSTTASTHGPDQQQQQQQQRRFL